MILENLIKKQLKYLKFIKGGVLCHWEEGMSTYQQLIKIKQYEIPALPEMINESKLNKNKLKILRYNKSGLINYKKIREQELYYRGDFYEMIDTVTEEIVRNLNDLRLNEVEVRVMSKGESIAIFLLDFGYEVSMKDSYNYESIIDVFPDIERLEEKLHIDSDGIEFKNISYHPYSTNGIDLIRQSLEREKKIIKIPEGEGGSLFFYDGDEYRGDEHIVLVAKSEQLIPYMNSYIRNKEYGRVVVVGGEIPPGFSELDDIGLDLIGFMRDTPSDIWMKLFQLMEIVYWEQGFAVYLNEAWIAMKEDISPEQEEQLDYSYFYGQLEGSDLSIPDYKRVSAFTTLSRYRNSEIFERKGEIMEMMKKIPNLLWIPGGSINDTLITLVFLLLRMDDMGERVDLVTIANSGITDSILRDKVYPIIRDVLTGTRTIYMSNKPDRVSFKSMIKILLTKNNRIMRYLGGIREDASLLDGDVAILPNGDYLMIDVD